MISQIQLFHKGKLDSKRQMVHPVTCQIFLVPVLFQTVAKCDFSDGSV